MSEISFKLSSDVSNFQSGLTACSKSVDTLGNEVESLEVATKKAFNSPTKELADLGKEINKGAKGIKDFAGEADKIGHSIKSIKEIKKEIKDLTNEAFKAGAGTQKFTDNLQKAGELKHELGELNKQAKALTGNLGENLSKATIRSIGLISSSMEGFTSISILAGEKTEAFEETLLKLQAFNGLANVANEFSEIGIKIDQIKAGFSPVVDLFKDGASNIVSGYGSANESLKGFFTGFKGNAKDAFKTGLSSLKDFGSNAGSVAKSAGSSFVSFFSNFGTNMKSFATSAKSGINTIGTAIKANPLGVILTVITLIVAAFALLTDKFKPLTVIFEGLGRAISDVGKEIEKFAQSLGLMASEEEKKAENFIKNTQSETEAIKAKFDAEIKLAKASGKETIALELKKQDAVFQRQTETIKYLQAIYNAEGKLNEEQKKQLEEAKKTQKESFQEKLEIQAAYATEQRNKAKEEADKLQKEAKVRADKAKADAEKNAKDLADALNDLRKRSESAELSGLNGQAKLDFIRKVSLEEYEILRASIEKKGLLTDKNFKFSAEQEIEFGKLKNQINSEYYANSLALQIEASNKLAQQSKANSENELANLELRNSIVKNNLESSRAEEGATFADKLTFEEEKKTALLKVELNYQKEKLVLTLNSIEAENNLKTTALQNELQTLNTRNDAISNARKNAINAEISAIATNSALVKQEAIASTDNIIKGIEEELNKPKASRFNIGKLLNLDDTEISTALNIKFNANIKPEDIANAKQALGQLAESLKQVMSAYFDEQNKKLDKELGDNQKRIDMRNENISSLEESLKAEKALQDQGFANNVDRVQKAIEEQEKARQKDLDNEKRIKEQKKKLAKEQLTIDTVVQASNLIVAVSKVFATYAELPFVAAALAAAMVGAFVYTKSRAYDAVNKGEFYDGGYTGDGGKYEEAGTVHRGEFVHTKETTKKHRNLFEGLHNNDDRLMTLGLRELIKDKGISLISEIPNQLNNTKHSIRNNEVKMVVNNNSGVEDKLNNVEYKLDLYLGQLVKQGNESEVVLNDGTRIIKRNGIIQYIKNSNNG